MARRLNQISWNFLRKSLGTLGVSFAKKVTLTDMNLIFNMQIFCRKIIILNFSDGDGPNLCRVKK